jgi:hypothetical protein
MQMLETLRTYVKSLLLEQEEREQNEEQEIKEVKELFQRWIDEYSASYLAFRKNVRANALNVTQISVRELNNFIFISLDLREHISNDWYIIIYNIENKSIYCANTKVLALTFARDDVLAFAFTLTFTHVKTLAYYIESGLINKVSVEQFRRVMQVTKGNYAQFEVLINKIHK